MNEVQAHTTYPPYRICTPKNQYCGTLHFRPEQGFQSEHLTSHTQV